MWPHRRKQFVLKIVRLLHISPSTTYTTALSGPDHLHGSKRELILKCIFFNVGASKWHGQLILKFVS